MSKTAIVDKAEANAVAVISVAVCSLYGKSHCGKSSCTGLSSESPYLRLVGLIVAIYKV